MADSWEDVDEQQQHPARSSSALNARASTFTFNPSVASWTPPADAGDPGITVYFCYICSLMYVILGRWPLVALPTPSLFDNVVHSTMWDMMIRRTWLG